MNSGLLVNCRVGVTSAGYLVSLVIGLSPGA
jgi:hypothetical protein